MKREGNSNSGKRLLIIGGGAAGVFCAVNAARQVPGLEVIVAEKTTKLLSKVKVSGGGRCNVTHDCREIGEMVKRYPRGERFLKKAFHYFFTTDTIEWFQERGVALKTEPDGRMFPVTNSSQTIIDCLLNEATKYGVRFLMSRSVEKIETSSEGFSVSFSNSEVIQADFVCIACGGFPKLSQFDWIKALGHTIQEPVPSLFTFNLPGNPITELMGISVEKAKVKIAGSKLADEGPLLITHWGLSGPAILKLSAWGARELASKNWNFTAIVNWLPEYNDNSLRDAIGELRFSIASQKISNKNPFGLPARLWDYILKLSGIKEEWRWADLPSAEQNKLIKNITGWEAVVKGKTTFKDEFVTAGGVTLSEVDPNTMMSKIVPNLFFAGEILDVDGVTGGFNFQNAWTSGAIVSGNLKI